MSLSSLIVQREVATMRQVEEALARQVIYGGDLVTNLLEVARVDERVLTGLLAESMRLPPAPHGELPSATPSVRALVPPEIAVERTVVPLEIQASGKLVLAVAEPLPRDVEEQLAFALGMGIEQRAAPSVRVQQAVARAYGIPLDRRIQRLVARLSGESTTNGSMPPPLGAAPAVPEPPRPPSGPPARVRGPSSTVTGAPAVAGHLLSNAPPRYRTSTSFPAVRPDQVAAALEAGGTAAVTPAAGSPPAPAPAASVRTSTATFPLSGPAAPAPAPPAAQPEAEQPGAAHPAPAERAPAPAAPAEAPPLAPHASTARAAAPAPPAPPVPPAPSVPPAPPAAESRPELLQRAVSTSVPPVRRRRGPLTVATANTEAEDAADRDALLDLFFEFSRQFFDYAALFLVHGDIAEGRDAFGSGVTRERVLGIGVPLDLPSMLSAARDKRETVVGKAAADGLDAVLLGDLQRSRTAEMAVVPLVVRTRAVAILIGDCGEGGVDRASLRDVSAFSATIGKAFERIIVRRKLEGFSGGAPESRVGRVTSPPPKAGAPAAVRTKSKRPSSFPPSALTSILGSVQAPAGAPPHGLASATAHGPSSADTQVDLAAMSAPAPAPASASHAAPAPSPRSGRDSRAPRSMPGTRQAASAPPPAANLATLRKIAGPPIPREEPEAAGEAAAPAHAAPAEHAEHAEHVEPAHASHAAPAAAVDAAPTPDAPEVEVSTGDVDRDATTLFDELGLVNEESELRYTQQSAAIATGPHRPPAPMGRRSDLPSIMVDGQAVGVDELDPGLIAMVDRLIAGEVDDNAEGELLRQGEKAMRAIMSRFPGPLTFSRARIATAANLPRPSDCGPLLRLIVRERRVALPFVLDRLTDSDPETRGWATHLLSELPYVEAIGKLLPRLRDVDAATSVAAANALGSIAKAFPAQVRDAVIAHARASERAERAAAVGAMAKLRDPAFVPELIRALGDPDDGIVSMANEALVQVTRQDHGTDARRWVTWWEANARRHRIEWLIDALAHEVTEIRRAAGDELRSLTKEYFGYSGDLPPRDRDRAQQRYRDWWAMEGRARFRPVR